MSCWRIKLAEAFEDFGDGFDKIEYIVPEDLDLDREFDDGFGLVEGVSFCIWTKARVYFPSDYDGAESVASVPRNPDKEHDPYHVGGGG